MTHPKTTSRRLHGFTVIELVVAVSVLALMLFLMNEIFFQTTKAVSTGVRTSTLLANARATNDRIALDTSAMLGPDRTNPVPEGGGYIIIINKEITAPVNRLVNDQVVPRLETFRVDQLIFVADANAANSRVTEFRASAPRNGAQYGSDFTSPYALIRYSHARRTQRDGTDIGGWNEVGGAPDPRPAFDTSIEHWGQNAGLDRLANDWILARETVLFSPTDSNNFLLQASDWYADWPFAATLPTPPFSPNTVANIGGVPALGYCDVTAAPASDSDPAVGFTNRWLDPTNPATGDDDARRDAYLALTHFGERLRVNPIPASTDDTNNDGEFDQNFEPWLVGQTHGIFAPNCSDFIVQFAADANNDGEIDRVGGPNGNDGGPGDPIFWYDMDSIDQLDGSFDDILGDPWAGPEWTGSVVPTPLVNVTGSNHGDYAFIFRLEDDQAYTESSPGNGDIDNSKWPYMIRIRYRLHDAPGKLGGHASFRQTDNRSNDDDNGDAVIDNTDAFDEPDEAEISGRYFEQIIRVPRP